MTIEGEKILLRFMTPEDVDHLLRWENDPDVWDVSGTTSPFSRETMEEFVRAPQDIYAVKQQRFMICLRKNGEPLGCVDLFDFDPNHHRAGIGILIYEPQHRRKGYAAEAIELLMQFAAENLRLHQVYCNVVEDNEASISLFRKLGFRETGTKLDWHASETGWKNEILLQCILTNDQGPKK